MRLLKIFVVLIVLMSLFGCVRTVVTANKMVNNGFDTAYNQFKPEELLAKYEYFKNAKASLDAKNADIKVLQRRITNMENMYRGTARKDWPRSDLEQYNIWSDETTGVILSYNSTAAEYNAQMAKFNWRFTNVGDLPKGETEVMPREYTPYKTE